MKQTDATVNSPRCPRCREPHAGRFRYCDDCREKVREFRALKLRAGFCVGLPSCRNRRRPGKTRCLACARYNAETVKRCRARRAERGMCIGLSCGSPPLPGMSRCRACLDYNAASSRKSRGGSR